MGSPVYTLQGEDPEGSRVRFGLQGTDKFEVDPNSGVVTVALPIDRESQSEINNNEIRFVLEFFRKFRYKVLATN